MNTVDTIAAPATAIGGAISVIRISGPDAIAVANRVWRGKTALGPGNDRKMQLGKVGQDTALAVCMCAPRSYTGENVAELQCHGGAAAADNAMRMLMKAGCRLAEPGEFTFRAYVNGRMDLAQAEAVNDTVRAGSAAAFNSATGLLNGVLSRKLSSIRSRLDELRADAEAHLDFPDEQLDFDETSAINTFHAAAAEIEELYATRRLGNALRNGIETVIAGRPNAGKSTLMNLLTGTERSIVTDIPGTTRDTVDALTELAGLPVHLTDTAGIHESLDAVEKAGIDRSRKSMRGAAAILWVLDATADRDEELTAMREIQTDGAKIIAVWNKTDITGQEEKLPDAAEAEATVKISALNGTGIDDLKQIFFRLFAADSGIERNQVAVNARCAGLLQRAGGHTAAALRAYAAGDFEISAAELRNAGTALAEITGENAAPDVLDAIFSKFCIGK